MKISIYHPTKTVNYTGFIGPYEFVKNLSKEITDTKPSNRFERACFALGYKWEIVEDQPKTPTKKPTKQTTKKPARTRKPRTKKA